MNPTETPIEKPESLPTVKPKQEGAKVKTPVVDTAELTFELGLWLSGLESFLNLYGNTLSRENYLTHDWLREFRLTHSVLLNCSKLTLELSREIRNQNSNNSMDDEIELLDSLDSAASISSFSREELSELVHALRESILLSDGLLRADSLNFSDWIVWNNSLVEKLKNVEVVDKLIAVAEKKAESFLPEPLKDLLSKSDISTSEEADLRLVFPHFAKILKWLSIVGEMLAKDKPLKTTLLLFAHISEQMQEMMDYINNRLLRYPNEEEPLFGSLDSAAYTASIELRKVYNQELKELIQIRPSPMVFAKIENSYSLLNDSLQNTLVDFARLMEPGIEASSIFPNIKVKEQQSIDLRQTMWEILQSVKEAEQDPENHPLDDLRKRLVEFGNNQTKLLFYKDIETVDRFIEEVLLTKENKDLVPILHRFGAYLETLLGQINMRVVLAKHPFEQLQGTNPLDMFE
ncbi:MAG: hypothetical protein HKN25_10440 [Pyrinomonadaceae bacterium]|nr:hypothetical protein [Pyrinomonadaceae bacterium]